MSTVLTQDRKKLLSRSIEGAVHEPLKQAYKETLQEAEAERAQRAGRSRTRRFFGTLLLISIGATVGYLLQRRRTDTDSIAEDLEPITESEPEIGEEPVEESGGRGIVSKLLLVGTVVGIGYVLKSRSGSVDEVVSEATEQVQSVTEKTIGESDQADEKVEEVAEKAEEASEIAAEGIESTGEDVSEQVDEAAKDLEEETEDDDENSD